MNKFLSEGSVKTLKAKKNKMESERKKAKSGRMWVGGRVLVHNVAREFNNKCEAKRVKGKNLI